MALVPKHQRFFYLVVAGSLVIMAIMILAAAQFLQYPRVTTSQAAGDTPVMDYSY